MIWEILEKGVHIFIKFIKITINFVHVLLSAFFSNIVYELFIYFFAISFFVHIGYLVLSQKSLNWKANRKNGLLNVNFHCRKNIFIKHATLNTIKRKVPC